MHARTTTATCSRREVEEEKQTHKNSSSNFTLTWIRRNRSVDGIFSCLRFHSNWENGSRRQHFIFVASPSLEVDKDEEMGLCSLSVNDVAWRLYRVFHNSQSLPSNLRNLGFCVRRSQVKQRQVYDLKRAVNGTRFSSPSRFSFRKFHANYAKKKSQSF